MIARLPPNLSQDAGEKCQGTLARVAGIVTKTVGSLPRIQGSPKAKSAEPAATATYCLPSMPKDIGDG